jgi:hypothetical protein
MRCKRAPLATYLKSLYLELLYPEMLYLELLLAVVGKSTHGRSNKIGNSPMQMRCKAGHPNAHAVQASGHDLD